MINYDSSEVCVFSNGKNTELFSEYSQSMNLCKSHITAHMQHVKVLEHPEYLTDEAVRVTKQAQCNIGALLNKIWEKTIPKAG